MKLIDESRTIARNDYIYDLCCRKISKGRNPMNGWNIIDDLGLMYERVDWDYIAQHV